jgi:hypothetical protein
MHDTGYQSQELQANQPFQEKYPPREDQRRTIREIVKGWLPTSTGSSLFVLVIVTALSIGVARFMKTGDTSTVMTVLSYVAAYVGLPEIKNLLPKREKGQQ